ncbi:MAG: ATP-binding protein [Pseudomonadota bacterium]|nr:ATP-binding protein [Pseudomonadota bacterium]
MIHSISFRNFKSYREATLPLAPLSLLIGANASGKSNAIEGVRFLSWLAEGKRLDDLMSAVQSEDQRLRGTIGDLSYEGTGTFGFRCTTDIRYGDELAIELRVSDDGMNIVAESVRNPNSTVPLYNVVEPGHAYSHELQVQYDNFARGGIKPRIPCSDQQAVFTQLETPARFAGRHDKAQRVIPAVVGQYRKLLEEILFLDPNPRAMREYSFIVDRSLKGDGSNISSVLYELCVKTGQKGEVLTFIRSLPEQDITDIDFIETPRSEVMVTLTESFGGRNHIWDVPVLSDGTLRVLAIAAALLSAPKDSLVIIEEIDNGVHPSRADMLLANIQRVAESRGVRVLVTTHNPALLDALPTQAIPDVVCCFRDPKEGDSRLIRLGDLQTYPALVAQGALGQLMTKGVIDRYLKDRTDPDEKKAYALEWMDSLRGGGSA